MSIRDPDTARRPLTPVQMARFVLAVSLGVLGAAGIFALIVASTHNGSPVAAPEAEHETIPTVVTPSDTAAQAPGAAPSRDVQNETGSADADRAARTEKEEDAPADKSSVADRVPPADAVTAVFPIEPKSSAVEPSTAAEPPAALKAGGSPDSAATTTAAEPVPAPLEPVVPAAAPLAPEVSPPALSEAALREELRRGVPELRLAPRDLTALRRASVSDANLKKLVASRAELRSLPFRLGDDARTERNAAELLDRQSREFNLRHGGGFVGMSYQFGSKGPSFHMSFGAPQGEVSEKARAETLKQMLAGPDWSSPESVPGIEQMLQTEPVEGRHEMVAALARLDGLQAGQALARRALFDLSPEIRKAAVDALRHRPARQYDAALLAAFRYVWPQAAWNAAEAMVQLDRRDQVPALTALLDQPDPAAPFTGAEGGWKVRELVAVSHLRNCQLCHARSTSNTDLVRGPIPIPGEPLPQGNLYQHHRGDFVRADVVYLKHDFSAMQPVPDEKPWPPMQRFDYLVRERAANPLEIAAATAAPAKPAASYPQRDAVLYALHKLTRRDGAPRK